MIISGELLLLGIVLLGGGALIILAFERIMDKIHGIEVNLAMALSLILTVLWILVITGMIHSYTIKPIIVFNGINTEKKALIVAGFSIVSYTVLYYYLKLCAFLIGKIFKGK